MPTNSRILVKQVGWALLFAALGMWVALAAKQDALFCSAVPVLCNLPPRGLGLYFFIVSAFALFSGCIDLSRVGIQLALRSDSASDDGLSGIRRPLLLALAQTV